jgi:hypothetical protein
MRHATLALALMLSIGGVAAAQDAEDPASTPLTKGELSVLLLKVGQPGQPSESPEQSLKEVKDLGIVPSDWQVADVVTHGEFADVVARFGVRYLPADPEAVISVGFAEAYLRRELSRLREYMTKRTTHTHMQDVLYEERGRAVSPSDF